jgi:hypothetical protein
LLLASGNKSRPGEPGRLMRLRHKVQQAADYLRSFSESLE